jgi:site-specific DNA recombinase
VNAKTRAAIYLRESKDRKGDMLGVTRHGKECRRIATERGWQVVAEYVDNNLTASDKRKDRPAYDRMVAAYEAGEFDAILCWDLDRLTRQPRQLEDWVDAAEERGLVLVTANGEADLSTDGGRLYARIKAAVARAEIERKAERQRLAAAQRAELGRPPLGVRLTGYTTKGEIIEHEAAIVRQMFERFHAGDSLRSIAEWLNDTGVPARNGKPWNPSSVRTILTNPRYCGRAIYQGKTNGHRGGWTPIVDEGVFDAVNEKLRDPRRRSQVGTDRKYLGSGLYLCGVCDHPVRSHTSAGVGARYRCPAGHVLRSGAAIDDYVLAILRARLARPDLAGLLATPESDEARQVAAEIERLRQRLRTIEADYDNELIDGRRYKIATEKVRAELAAVEAARTRMLARSGIAPLLTAPDPVAAFNAAPLGVQREVLSFFMTVKLLPAPRGRRGFDPETVQVEWNQGGYTRSADTASGALRRPQSTEQAVVHIPRHPR